MLKFGVLSFPQSPVQSFRPSAEPTTRVFASEAWPDFRAAGRPSSIWIGRLGGSRFGLTHLETKWERHPSAPLLGWTTHTESLEPLSFPTFPGTVITNDMKLAPEVEIGYDLTRD